ncbi:hypothetical protein HYW18_01635 [Candidatus Uhrbacteria bacterium]|nr:hypothetical protein [Candidatus Uhrbacteria bacterium]
MRYCKPHWPLVLGVVGALAFVAEYLWQLVLASEELRVFHMLLLKTYVIGFTGMNTASFVLGLVQWFIWGAVIGGLIVWISGMCKCQKGEGGCCGAGHCGG